MPSDSTRADGDEHALPSELAPLTADDPGFIGPFRLVGRLGAGGMGTVYGALDDSGRCIAVKVIHPRFAQQGDYRERFAYEAELVRQVDAECAPAFLGADSHAQTPWLATEFVPGRTLRAHVGEYGPLTGAALLSLAAGAAEALAAVHAGGVVHRDIKPGNVILAPEGPRLLDFGIARAVDDTAPEQGLLGTPGWLAPEQMAGMPASTRSDVFAWAGLVVYAATGRGPYGQADTATLIERMRAGQVSSQGVPDDLRPLIDRALAGDPHERPDAREVYDAVLALSGEDSQEAPRERLRRLLQAAWRGFDAAGHRPESWVAAAGGAAVVAAGLSSAGAAAGAGAGGASGGSSAVAVAAGGTGTVAGMTKTTALVVAGLTATAVTTGGWVDGRTATDQPVIPATGAPASSGPSLGGSGAPSSEEPVELEFRGMSLQIPPDWEVHRQEDTFDPVYSEEPPTTDEWVLLQTDPEQECGSPEWVYGHYECDRIMIFGPGGIQGASMAAEFRADFPYQPENEPYTCDPALRTFGGEPRPIEPEVAETTDVGGSTAQYRQWRVGCIDAPGDRVTSEGPQVFYDQRLWYLADPEILIVDNYDTEGIGEILAEA